MTSSNRIKNVAIVGAGGNLGRFIAEALLGTGKHQVSAITRADSQSSLPKGVDIKKVDYESQETLVEALRGQDALVITISGRSPMQQIEEKLIRAAAEAKVPWILPNEWSPDSANEGIVKDIPFLFGIKVAARKLIEDIGQSSYVALNTGFWYEYSLGIPGNYGFDFAKKEVTFWDDGKSKVSTSTWPQIGRAVAALLNLPIKSESTTGEASLEKYKNQVVYINSFTVSQEQMLDSAVRVTGSNKDDWTVATKPAWGTYEKGIADMKQGKFGANNFLYSRIFLANGGGDFEHSKGASNHDLGLPKEDIDEATKRAIERQAGSK